MIEDVFVAYVNNSLKVKPNLLLTFSKVVKENKEIDLEDGSEVVLVLADLASASA